MSKQAINQQDSGQLPLWFIIIGPFESVLVGGFGLFLLVEASKKFWPFYILGALFILAGMAVYHLSCPDCLPYCNGQHE